MTSTNSVFDSDNSNSDETASTALIAKPNNNAFFMEKTAAMCFINKGTQNELKCEAYKHCLWKIILSTIFTIVTGGFLLLIFYWRPDWKLLCTCSRTNWQMATKVYLTTIDGTNQRFVSNLSTMSFELAYLLSSSYPNLSRSLQAPALTKCDNAVDPSQTVIWFKHHLSKFIWNQSLQTFVELSGLSDQASLCQLHDNASKGLSQSEIGSRINLFGHNLITVEIPSYLRLLLSEILNPFYIFQLFAVIFWMFDQYIIYATAIFIVSIMSAIVSLIQVRQERVRLHDMVEYHSEIRIDVLRDIDGEVKQFQIWSKDLVPGDVILIPSQGSQLPCDAVLISGTCIVNESMLTGESVPVTKTSLPSSPNEMAMTYDIEIHKRHSLFCGTEVLQTRFYRGELVKAVVVQTGFHTSKGRLVHSILYPKPMDLKLLHDAYRFVGLLFLMAMGGFIYTVIIMYFRDEDARDIAFSAIDLITISVPPALPLAMTVGILYAQLRLKSQKIHCISPQRINISGQIDVVAFDKTGTLTEDGLDMYSAVPVNLKQHNTERDSVKFTIPLEPSALHDLAVNDKLIQCMVCCHTLTTIDGRLSGDPLDVKMFEATGWNLVEPAVEDATKYDRIQTTYMRPPRTLVEKFKKSKNLETCVDSVEMLNENTPPEGRPTTESSMYDLGIVRQFPFSSSLQRSSVIVKPYQSSAKDLLVFLKGAPETVAKLCCPDTLPLDFHEVLKTYTQQGLRMIGLAYKPLTCSWLKAQKLERQTAEEKLIFIGLIALENKLKPQSSRVLKKLHNANIRTLMVTGDNLLTSLSVARESGMISTDDSILIASTTLPTSDKAATLTWLAPDKSSTSDQRVATNSFSSVEEKPVSNNRTVQICMGAQIPPTWHLAVSGPSFEVILEYFPEWVDVLASKGTVFARMSPSQKTLLIEALQDIDYHVCMCGDGANDCGALKRAHAGLSLSDYESSVAASFTSNTDKGVECVPTLIREGRAALVTSFGMFKFMALYSVIQFCTVTILYNKLSNLGDLQYLYIDLIVIDLLALTMSRNHAYKKLVARRPPTGLVSLEILVSLIFQILLQCAVQVFVYFLVISQCWYTELTPAEAANTTYGNNETCPSLNHVPDQSHVENEFNILTYENSALFVFSSLLYISVSVAFSRGKPFRTPVYKNYLFLLSLLVLLFFGLFLFFISPQAVDDFFQIRTVPDIYFNLELLAIAVGHLLVAVTFEMFVVEQQWIWVQFRRWFSCIFPNRVSKRHKVILQHLDCTAYANDVEIENGQVKIPNPFVELGKPIHSKTTKTIAMKTRL